MAKRTVEIVKQDGEELERTSSRKPTTGDIIEIDGGRYEVVKGETVFQDGATALRHIYRVYIEPES
jgi:hypothetical protein